MTYGCLQKEDSKKIFPFQLKVITLKKDNGIHHQYHFLSIKVLLLKQVQDV